MEYSDEILDSARRYFDPDANWPACGREENDKQNRPVWMAKPIPTPAGFAAIWRISKKMLKTWMKEHEDFRMVMDAGAAVTERNILECATKGAMSPTLGKAALEQLADWKLEEERSVSINVVIPPALSKAERDRAFPAIEYQGEKN